jgi:hypothetical protein
MKWRSRCELKMGLMLAFFAAIQGMAKPGSDDLTGSNAGSMCQVQAQAMEKCGQAARMPPM